MSKHICYNLLRQALGLFRAGKRGRSAGEISSSNPNSSRRGRAPTLPRTACASTSHILQRASKCTAVQRCYQLDRPVSRQSEHIHYLVSRLLTKTTAVCVYENVLQLHRTRQREPSGMSWAP